MLKDDEKLEMMAPHVDQYLLVCVLQLRIVYSKHMSDDADTDTGIRLYRCVLGSLLSVSPCRLGLPYCKKARIHRLHTWLGFP